MLSPSTGVFHYQPAHFIKNSRQKMTCRETLLRFLYVLYFVSYLWKTARTNSRRCEANTIKNQIIVQKISYYIMKFITRVLYVYIHFHLAALKNVYLSLYNKQSYGQIWGIILLNQINHSIARMLNSALINIISEAKLLKLFILTDQIFYYIVASFLQL